MITTLRAWARVGVRDVQPAIAWCGENLNHNDWVCSSIPNGDEISFRFRDEKIATEFALRFA
jgi:hypothetical protein